MMPQSVDFLKVLPKPINRVPAWLMAVIIFVPVFILIILSVISYINYSKVQTNLMIQEEHLRTAQAAYNDLIRKYPLLANNVPLLNLVSTIEQEYNTKVEKFESLKYLIVRPGFSKYLLNLAQITPTSLWLNRIQINHSLSLVTLDGYTIRPDSVSELMTSLSTTEAFNDVIFNSFFVRALKNHTYAKFSISTHEIKPEEETVEPSKQVTIKAKE